MGIKKRIGQLAAEYGPGVELFLDMAKAPFVFLMGATVAICTMDRAYLRRNEKAFLGNMVSICNRFQHGVAPFTGLKQQHIPPATIAAMREMLKAGLLTHAQFKYIYTEILKPNEQPKRSD